MADDIPWTGPLTRITARVSSVDARLDGVGQRLAGLEARVEAILVAVAGIDRRLRDRNGDIQTRD